MKPVAFAYRTNDEFEATLPPLAQKFKERGHEVKEIIYERTHAPEEIRADLEKKIDELKGAVVMTDATVGSALMDALGIEQGQEVPEEYTVLHGDGERARCKSDSPPAYLDALRDKAARVEAGVEGVYKHNSDGGLDEATFKERLSETVRSIKRQPDRVYVATEQLSEHGPFWKPGRFDANAVDHEAGELVKRGLVEGGIPEERITILGRESAEQRVPEGEVAWVIHDRHLKGYDVPVRGRAYRLQLPLSTFLHTAYEQGLTGSGSPDAAAFYTAARSDIARHG